MFISSRSAPISRTCMHNPCDDNVDVKGELVPVPGDVIIIFVDGAVSSVQYLVEDSWCRV